MQSEQKFLLALSYSRMFVRATSDEQRAKKMFSFCKHERRSRCCGVRVCVCDCISVFGLFCAAAELMHSKEKFKAEQISRSLSLFIFMASRYTYIHTYQHMHTHFVQYVCRYSDQSEYTQACMCIYFQ